MGQEERKRSHLLVTGLRITDETEWDFEAVGPEVVGSDFGLGAVKLEIKKRRLLIRHYSDGVWEILDENHNSLISGSVNDPGLKR